MIGPAMFFLLQLSAADRTAALKAAGFTRHGAIWRTDCDDTRAGLRYEPGRIEHVEDLNGDGRPEAVIVEGGIYCYGMAGAGFMLVSKQQNGRWRPLYQSQGTAHFLEKRANGWPDLEIRGPGVCSAVLRWNGKEYSLHHYNEYVKGNCSANGLRPSVPAR